MPKLNSFFEKENKIEQIMTKKMHPQLISYKNLNESRFQYKEISKEDVEKLADLIEIEGGAKPNAIPRYSRAIIAVNEEDIKDKIDEIEKIIDKLNKI